MVKLNKPVLNQGLPELPKGWSQASLNEVALLTMGQSPVSATYNNSMKGMAFFQGAADFGVTYPKARYWCSQPKKMADQGSILFSVRAPVGELNLAPYRCCIGRGLAAIKVKKESNKDSRQGSKGSKGSKNKKTPWVDQAFLFQMLQYMKPKFQVLSQGSAFEVLNGADLKQFNLMLPSLFEQQKIATILLSADKVIEILHTQLNKLNNLKMGMMQRLFTQGIGHTKFKNTPMGRLPFEWQVAELAEYLAYISYGFTNPMPESAQGHFMITAKDIAGLAIQYTGARKTTPLAFNRLTEKSKPKINDILLTKDGTLGRVALVKQAGICINQSVAVLRANEKILPQFLLYLLASPVYQRELLQSAEGSTIKHIYITLVDKMPIAVPNITEQKKIVDLLDAIFLKLTLFEAKLNQQVKIKKALMQNLLTGKVRVG